MAKEAAMYVAVIHDIRDPEKFWAAADSSVLPQDVALHNVLPNTNGTRCVCVWQADSVETVTDLVDSTVGEWSSNEFFEVGENARGLPS